MKNKERSDYVFLDPAPILMHRVYMHINAISHTIGVRGARFWNSKLGRDVRIRKLMLAELALANDF